MSDPEQKPEDQPKTLPSMGRGGLLLAVFAIIGAALLASTHLATRDRIADNQQARLIAALDAVLPAGSYQNVPAEDFLEVTAIELSRTPVRIYRARNNKQAVATVIETTAPDGYNGQIKLLVGITTYGTVSGVRVVNHRETPGLGDGIEHRRSPWIEQYNGRALGNPTVNKWAVQKDDGFVDALTGATITSRAVTAAVKRALLYFRSNQAELFKPASSDV